jgi:hypothetical protein
MSSYAGLVSCWKMVLQVRSCEPVNDAIEVIFSGGLGVQPKAARTH